MPRRDPSLAAFNQDFGHQKESAGGWPVDSPQCNFPLCGHLTLFRQVTLRTRLFHIRETNISRLMRHLRRLTSTGVLFRAVGRERYVRK